MNGLRSVEARGRVLKTPTGRASRAGASIPQESLTCKGNGPSELDSVTAMGVS